MIAAHSRFWSLYAWTRADRRDCPPARGGRTFNLSGSIAAGLASQERKKAPLLNGAFRYF
jgi:hypothetical protein